MTTIMGIKLDNRTQTAMEFQKILTHFGCIIKTRLGLHDVSDNKCAPNGIILLEVIDDEQAIEFEKELCKIVGIEIQIMKFS
ncbi:MAG: hypothetical protein WCY19_04050 [Candidatus Gastranaerophilaceae bacterium]